MSFDDAIGRVVLFGGWGDYGTLADTWSWSGSRWERQVPIASASSRAFAAMTYDPRRRQLLMLSGEAAIPLTDPCRRVAQQPPVCTPPSELRDVSPGSDLWGYDTNGWHELLPRNIAPDPAGGLTTLSDGAVLALASSGTWLYNGKVWTNVAAGNVNLQLPVGIAVDPTTRAAIAVVRYQPGVCMPHSGCQHPAYMRVFRWTGTAWRELDDQHTPMLAGYARRQSNVVADPAGGGLLALGVDHATWRRSSAGVWAQVASASASPPPLDGMTLASDPAHHEVIAFGGETPPQNPSSAVARSNDTWIWNGARWQRLTAPISPTPQPTPPTPVGCTLNAGALIGFAQPPADHNVRITGSDLFVTPPCTLHATITLTLAGADGQALRVPGNPSIVAIDTTAAENANVLSLVWTWHNACAAGPVHAELKGTGPGAPPTPFPIGIPSVSACTTHTESQLVAEPAHVGSSQ
jgi:hypothetical protein